jgi:hypothetical protein
LFLYAPSQTRQEKVSHAQIGSLPVASALACATAVLAEFPNIGNFDANALSLFA